MIGVVQLIARRPDASCMGLGSVYVGWRARGHDVIQVLGGGGCTRGSGCQQHDRVVVRRSEKGARRGGIQEG